VDDGLLGFKLLGFGMISGVWIGRSGLVGNGLLDDGLLGFRLLGFRMISGIDGVWIGWSELLGFRLLGFRMISGIGGVWIG
jgi:hypothetical protein